jgi:hypothetical protein
MTELDEWLAELRAAIDSRDTGEMSDYGGGISNGLNIALDKLEEFEPKLREIFERR